MMLMMVAKGARIISIIGGPFLQFWPPMSVELSQPYPEKGLGASFQTVRAPDAAFFLGGVVHKNPSKINP